MNIHRNDLILWLSRKVKTKALKSELLPNIKKLKKKTNNFLSEEDSSEYESSSAEESEEESSEEEEGSF